MSVFLDAQPIEYRDQVADLICREVVEMAVLAHFDFADQALFLSNRNIPFEDLKWGHTWGAGSGLLVGVPNIGGGDGQLAPEQTFYLGLPFDAIEGQFWMADVLNSVRDVKNYRGRSAGLYGQVFDPETGAPVGYPFAFMSGLMDRKTVRASTKGVLLGLPVESLLARKNAPVYGMQTYFDQKRRHPTDEGLEFTTESGRLVDWTRF